MEEKMGLNGSGVAVKSDEAPQSYRVDHRVENLLGSTHPPAPAQLPGAVAPPSTELRKKRGRPRKYAGDGSAVALSPMPISASIPFSGDYPSSWKSNPMIRPVEAIKKKQKLEFESPGVVLGRMVPSPPIGGCFTPHMITVNTGEDIMMKIISFSQQGSRAICVLAANGTVSNVTLRQPNSSGGTLTYEGRFEILSLKGSFMPTDNDHTKSRSGGMSVSLAGPDGRVLGGGLAGMLVAASPVQIVIGSFVPTHQRNEVEQRQTEKPKYEQTISFAPMEANPVSEHRNEAMFNGLKPNLMTSSVSFRGDNLASVHGPRINDNLDAQGPEP